MKPLGETKHHFWLAQRMARLHGLDLAESVTRGDLDQATWAAMVLRCRACDWVEGCERFLDRGRREDDLPKGCLNRTGLGVLKTCDELEI